MSRASSSTESSSFVFTPPPMPSVEIRGSDQRFPVHRVYCVGRNYADHIREMGEDPNMSQPSMLLLLLVLLSSLLVSYTIISEP